MKKFISYLLTLMIIVFMFAQLSFVTFADEQTVDIPATQLGTSDTYYSFDAQTKTLTISGEGATPDFSNSTVPWYNWRSVSIDKVVVEDGITTLGKYLFCYVNASQFELADSIKTIKEGTFYCVNKTKTIVLPNKLESIGSKAFYSSYNFEEIFIPKTVKTIGMSAFESCSKLSKVNFESDYMTVSIGSKAFFKCPMLKSIFLPRNAKLSSYSIGYSAATAGSIYDGFKMYAYRDSSAYTYAGKNVIDCILRDSMAVFLDDVIVREYLAGSLDDTMYFTFTPQVTDEYTFSSDGDVDVDCILINSAGEEKGPYDDNSNFDRNFTAKELLNAGETYTYKINSDMSAGEFSVKLVQSHSYTQDIIPPDLYHDGYTINTCIYCGYQYKFDFVERTGKDISGTVVLMENPSGEHSHNLPLCNVSVHSGDYDTVTDEDGYFYFTVPKTAESITIRSPYGVDRIVPADNCNLGSIAFFAYDYVQDGYVNAKDYAWLRSRFGSDDKSLDYNQDGVVNQDDWIYAEAFFTYGKITESIYD